MAGNATKWDVFRNCCIGIWRHPLTEFLRHIAVTTALMALITGKVGHLVHESLVFLPEPPPLVHGPVASKYASHDEMTTWLTLLVGAIYVWQYLRHRRKHGKSPEGSVLLWTTIAFLVTSAYVWVLLPLYTCTVNGERVTVGLEYRPAVNARYNNEVPSCQQVMDDYGQIVSKIWSPRSLILAGFLLRMAFVSAVVLCCVASIAVMGGLWHAVTTP